MRAGVLDAVTLHGGGVRHFVLRVQGDRPLLQRSREGEDLAGRAGLEDVGDRPVAAVLLGRVTRGVRIVGGVVGQRQHLSGTGVEHHGAGTGGTPGLRGARRDLLRLPLEVTIDGQCQVLAVNRRGGLLTTGRDDLPLCTPLVLGATVGAAQLFVIRVLGAGKSHTVGTDEAQHVPADGAGRVDALRDAVGPDPGDPQGQCRITHSRVHVLVQVHEAPLAREGLLGLGHAPSQHRGELLGSGRDPLDLGLLRVLEVVDHLTLIDPQVVALHGAGQHRAVAVHDVAAQRRDGAGDGALLDGLLGSSAGIQALHPDQAAGQRHHGDHDQRKEEAVAHQGAAHAGGGYAEGASGARVPAAPGAVCTRGALPFAVRRHPQAPSLPMP